MTNHTDLTYPPMSDEIGRNAYDQLGPCVVDPRGSETYGVRGIDGGRYVLEQCRDGWQIIRAGHYGPGAVVQSGTPKGAVQRLNAFHEGETCIHCGHVNEYRGHGCAVCGRRRYA